MLLLVSTSINQSWMWPWTIIKNELILWFCRLKSFDGDLVEIGLLVTIVYHICPCLSQQQQLLILLASAEEKVFFALMQPFNNRCGLLSFIVIDQCLQGLAALKIQNVILSSSVLANQKALEWLKVMNASCFAGPWKVMQ